MASRYANEIALHHECFEHLAEDNSVLQRALSVLELIANTRTGLGEVLQGYARQAGEQLRDIITAAKHIVTASPTDDDLEILHNAPQVVKTVSKVLEMTPGAMKRNNAEVLGKKERLTTENIEQISYIFTNSPDVKLLLTYEEVDEDFIVPEETGASWNATL